MIPFLNQKIWYAFQGLPFERVGDNMRLPWSKCSVLTNNLMYILHFDNLTEHFSKVINKTEVEANHGVTFEEYIDFINSYLKTERQVSCVIEDRNSSPIPVDQEIVPPHDGRVRRSTLDSSNLSQLTTSEDKRNPVDDDMSKLIKTFNDYSWTLYRTKNLPNLGTQSFLHDSFYNLWLLFITYSIKDEYRKNVKIPVVMDLVEAKYWCSRVQELICARRVFQEIDFDEEVTEINFKDFYEMIQDLIKSVNLDELVLKLAFESITEEALDSVIMKGPIRVDRYVRYCVLKSAGLMMYNSKVNATNYRSTFLISKETEIITGLNKFQLRNAGSTITIETSDIQKLNKWRTAISDAIYFAKNNISNPSIHDAETREKARQSRRLEIRARRVSVECKLEEERNARSRITEAMKQQLHQADEELELFRQKIQEELKAKEDLLKEGESIRKEKDEQIQKVLTEQEVYKIQLEKLQMIESERQYLNEQLQATKDEKCLEEQKRTYLEEKHMESLQMLSDAEEKILSLKKLGDELKKALEDERQAKEEEEVVRNATMKLLEEEKQSKIKLEELLAQQTDAINSEILKSSKIAEDLQKEKMRIYEIAEEKEKLAKQLEDSQKRQQSTGNRVKNLDSKVTKIAETVFWREDSKIPVSHRGQGFIAEIMVQTQLQDNQKRLQNLQTKESSNEILLTEEINEDI